jgi:hypothetical protein
MHSLASILIPPSNLSWAYLKDEQKICVEFANEMRMLTLAGNFPYVWFHIPNEFLPSARKNYSFDLKLKHMGKISGVPDYCFTSSTDSFFIEFKANKGKQTENQKIFQAWCTTTLVDYLLCYSAQEAIDFVKDRSKKICQPKRSCM